MTNLSPNRNLICSTHLHSLLILVAILMSLSRGAASATGAGTITQLSSGSSTNQQNEPAISGTRVVWTNALTLPSGTANFDTFLLDVASGTPAVNLNNTPADQEFLPDIDNGNIVWIHTATNTIPGDIVLYNIVSGTATTIATSSPALFFQQPAIRGHYVAFVRGGSQFDISLYDIVAGTTTAITNDIAVQAHPRVGSDMVVYEDYNTGTGQIVGYRISTSGPPTAMSPGTANQVTPDIDGNTVVWVQTVSGSDQIFALDMTTNTVTQLTTVASSKILPRISGNRIIWSDDRAGNLDIYMYDLSTHAEQALIAGVGDQFLSDIDGDRVVYVSNAAGFEQVYEFVFDNNDFSIAASPTSLTVTQGAATATTISTAVTAGVAETIDLSVSGVPAGASVSFSPVAINAGGSSTLTVNSGTAAPGVTTLTVTGTEGSMTHTTSVTLTVTSAYVAAVQQPINADGSSVFNANRGVIPVKFTLTTNGVPTCTLPAAALSLFRTAGSVISGIDESVYEMSADTGSNFRISGCQYIYNLSAKPLGTGTYRIDISIGSTVVGSAVFALK